MADETIKTLLTKMTLDPSNWKEAWRDIRETVEKASEEDKKRSKEQLSDLRTDAQLSKQAADIKLKASQEQLRAEQQRLAALKRSHAESFAEGKERAKMAAQLQKDLKITQAQVEANKKITSELQNQIRQYSTLGQLIGKARGGGAGGREGGGEPGFLGSIFNSLIPRSGLSGSIFRIAAGTAVGATAGEFAVEGIRHLIETIHELGQEASEEAQLEITLGATLKGRGMEEEEFIDKMRTATYGLVDPGELMKDAVIGFRTQSKLTAAQMVELTANVTKVALSLHGPEGINQAMMGLNRFLLTGRGYALAMAVGLNQATMRVGQFGGRLSELERDQLSATQTMALMAAIAKTVPEPLHTVSMALEEEKIAHEHLEHELVAIIETSPPLVHVIEDLANVLDQAQADVTKNAEKWGDTFDQLVDVFLMGAQGIVSVIQAVSPVIGDLLKLIPKVTFISNLLRSHQNQQQLSDIQMSTHAAMLAQTPEQLIRVMEGSLVGQQAAFSGHPELLPKNITAATFTKAKAEFIRLNAEASQRIDASLDASQKALLAASDAQLSVNSIQTKVTAALQSIQAALSRHIGEKRKGSAQFLQGLMGGTGEIPDEQIAQMQLQEMAKLQQDQIQNDLTLRKTAADNQLKILEDHHRQGLIDDAAYAVKSVLITQHMYEDQETAALKTRDIQIKLEKQKAEDPKIQATTIKDIQTKTNTKLIELENEKNQKILSLMTQLTGEENEDQKKQIALTQENAMEAIQTQMEALQTQYQEGGLLAATFYKKQRGLIEEQAAVYVKSQYQILSTTQMTQQQREQIVLQTVQKLKGYDQQLAKTYPEELLKTRAETVAGLQSKLSTAKTGVSVAQLYAPQGQPAAPSIISAQEEELTAIKNLRDFYTKELQSGTFQQGSQQYYETAEKAAELGVEFDKLNSQLNDVTTTSQKVADGFTSFLSSMPSLKAFAGISMPLVDTLQRWAVGNVQQDPFYDLFSSISGSGTGGGSDIASVAERFQSAMKDLGQIIPSIAQSIQSIQYARTGEQGAVAGIGLGAGVGGGIAKALPALGINLASNIAQAIPIVGGVIGGIIGGIEGMFTDMAQKIAQNVQLAFQKINIQLQEENINTAQAIAQLKQQYTEAQQKLTSTKGGTNIWNTLAPQLQQQMAQLEIQAQQTIDTFEQQLDSLNTLPPSLQDVGSQIQNIVNQWVQYINAGGSVVTANEYLSQSFANLEQTSMQQLNQSYQTAIQNALNYNQLLIQRQQLIQNEATQELQILSQGV
ncbi:MAG: hypothetical protein KGN01_06215, partial [Patescibacteria group bacterium]|nr:hypothetical protein [Patescibacteria group bacterium]